jgi:hypothetical protein
MWTEHRSPSPTVRSFCYYLPCPLLRMKRSSLLLSNGGSTVDCVTLSMCLSKRCSATDVHSGSTIPGFSCHITLLHPKGCSSRRAYRYHRPFLPGVFLWFGFSCGDFCPTALTSPSLRAARPEWPVPSHFRLILLTVLAGSSSFSEGADPSTMSTP